MELLADTGGLHDLLVGIGGSMIIPLSTIVMKVNLLSLAYRSVPVDSQKDSKAIEKRYCLKFWSPKDRRYMDIMNRAEGEILR